LGQLKNMIRPDIRVHMLGLDQASVDTTRNSKDELTDDLLSDSSEKVASEL